MNKIKITMLGFAAALALSAETPAPKKTAAAPAAAKALELPANAKPNGVNQWTHTDDQGQEWIYKRTPFGLTRLPKPGSALANAQGQNAMPSRLHEGISVREDGDTVHFSRVGPFGPMKWSKKRDELSEAEQAAIVQSRRAAAAATAAAPKK
jgi:hypothetical protein